MEPETYDSDIVDTDGSRSDEEMLVISLSKPAYFEVIVKRYEEPFLRKVRSIIQDEYLAEDIVQETFVKIYLNGRSFQVRENASFRSWAYTILINTAFSHYKKVKRDRGATVTLETEFYEALPDAKTLLRESDHVLNDFVASILCRMPADLARALTMHFIDGLPHKEIAEQEGLSTGAVKSRIHRAKKVFEKIHQALN